MRPRHINLSNGAARIIPSAWRRVYAPSQSEVEKYYQFESELESGALQSDTATQQPAKRYQDAIPPVKYHREATSLLQLFRDTSVTKAYGDRVQKREASTIVTDRRPEGYWRLFCAHDKALWQPCGASTCKRDKKEAESNWNRLVSGQLV